MIYRKFHSTLICASVCSVILSIIFPLNFNDGGTPYTVPNLALNLILYSFFVTTGLLIVGFPLGYAIEKITLWAGIKNNILINIITLATYTAVPMLYFNTIADTAGIQIIASIVAISYFMVDSLMLKNRYETISFRTKLRAYTIFLITFMIILNLLSLFILGISY